MSMTKAKHRKAREGYHAAIKYFGNITSVARALDITPAALWHWGEVVPLDRARELHIMTGGDLNVRDLRPDFFDGQIMGPRT